MANGQWCYVAGKGNCPALHRGLFTYRLKEDKHRIYTPIKMSKATGYLYLFQTSWPAISILAYVVHFCTNTVVLFIVKYKLNSVHWGFLYSINTRLTAANPLNMHYPEYTTLLFTLPQACYLLVSSFCLGLHQPHQAVKAEDAKGWERGRVSWREAASPSAPARSVVNAVTPPVVAPAPRPPMDFLTHFQQSPACIMV